MASKFRLGLGVVAAYSAYFGYVQIKTSREIARREARFIPPNEDQNRFHSMVVGGKYVNPFPEYRTQSLFEFFYRRITELFHETPRGGVPFSLKEIHAVLPTRRPDFDLLKDTTRSATFSGLLTKSNRELPSVDHRMTLTWLGQSCAYVQVPGLDILTDPCFGTHLVHPKFGPKRISPPPCEPKELPNIDIVLVSHDHPDHLDLEAVEQIGDKALWVVPLGVGKHLKSLGVSNILELDWWQRSSVPSNGSDWQILCTPAMHWSGRALYDSNLTLWGSFMLLKDGKPVFYHAGDTGYSPDLFQGIRRYVGAGPKVAMLPCGAYTPSWHLRPQHIDPREAVQVMQDLEAQKMVGVHWGTFVMSDEHYLEPRDLLHEIAEKQNVGNDVIAPEFGRTLVFNLHDENPGSPPRPIRDGEALLLD